MSVRFIVMPTGPEATPEAIESTKAAAQRLADREQCEVEIRATDPDTGALLSHLIAYPEPVR